MKNILLASACIFALATPAAFAQSTQPTGGASSSGNVGPGASEGAMKDGTMNPQGTTGASRQPSPRGDASTSSAPANSTGNATDPGAVKDGVRR